MIKDRWECLKGMEKKDKLCHVCNDFFYAAVPNILFILPNNYPVYVCPTCNRQILNLGSDSQEEKDHAVEFLTKKLEKMHIEPIHNFLQTYIEVYVSGKTIQQLMKEEEETLNKGEEQCKE